MRILLLSSFVIPGVSELIGAEKVATGGWVSTLLEGLSKLDNYDLSLVMKADVKSVKKSNLKGVTYYFIPQIGFKNENVKKEDVSHILNDYKPDLLQAEGAEHIFVKLFFQEFNGLKLINIKGVYNGIIGYEYGGLDPIKLIFSMSATDIILGFNLIYIRYFRSLKRLRSERETYQLANFVIGRTFWDKGQSKYLNDKATYFKCNEIIRVPFYEYKWSINNIEKYSILIGNGTLARKGAHVVIEAIKILKVNYPSIKLYIVGYRRTGFKNKIGYSSYISKLINDYGISEYIIFTGILNEYLMAETLVRKHVYVMPSTIENSPNMLGEAMIMGVPIVTSYCGGVQDVLCNEKEGLIYRDDDPKMLALQIERIFNDIELANKLSSNSIKRGKKIHNKLEIIQNMDLIYKSISKE